MSIRARIRHNWLSWAVLILALASAIQLAWFSRENVKITSCQTRYNQALAQALRERSQIATDDRTNMTRLVRTITTGKTREERTGALRTYLSTQERLDADRNSQPLPNLPPGKCQ